MRLKDGGNLAGGAGWGAAGPVLGSELDAPEVRGGGEEFDADASALFGGVAEVDDAALLLFLGDGIDEDEVGAHFEILVDIKKGAMGVDDDGLAVFVEFLATVIAAGDAHGYAGEDTRAAAKVGTRSGGIGRLCHKGIVRREVGRVNRAGRPKCPKNQFVVRLSNLRKF